MSPRNSLASNYTLDVPLTLSPIVATDLPAELLDDIFPWYHNNYCAYVSKSQIQSMSPRNSLASNYTLDVPLVLSPLLLPWPSQQNCWMLPRLPSQPLKGSTVMLPRPKITYYSLKSRNCTMRMPRRHLTQTTKLVILSCYLPNIANTNTRRKAMKELLSFFPGGMDLTM